MKECTKCGKQKSLNQFHKNKRAKDGRASACKDCANAADRIRDKSEKRRKKVRDWYKTPAGKAARKRYRQKSRANGKSSARQRFRYAVLTGKIKRQPCEICGKEDAFGHHEDYSKPYDVRWLCHVHHMEAHRIAEH